MSTSHLAARARPSNVTPFPSRQSRRVVPGPADFDPFDHGAALAERDMRAVLCRQGLSNAEMDDIVSFLMARCDEIIAEESARGAP